MADELIHHPFRSAPAETTGNAPAGHFDENFDPQAAPSIAHHLKKQTDVNNLKKKLFKTSIHAPLALAPTFLSENSHPSMVSNVEDVDATDSHLPLHISDHVVDIYKYLRWKEAHFVIPRNYLQSKKVTPANRATLIDWLVNVHINLKLLPETLYLTKQLLDVYLSLTNTSNRVLQLVGVSCLWIASKFEEIYPPQIDDLLYITDNTYDRHEMNECERSIIQTLKFDVNIPTSLAFLKRAAKCARVDVTIYSMAKYILELSFLEYQMAHYFPSHMASASLFLAIVLINTSESYTTPSETCWTNQAQYYTAYSQADLKPLATELSEMLQRKSAEGKKCEVNRKFRSEKLCSVSRNPICSHAKSHLKQYLNSLKP